MLCVYMVYTIHITLLLPSGPSGDDGQTYCKPLLWMFKPISLTHINLFPSGTSGGDGQTYCEAAWMDVYSRCPPAVVRPGVVRRKAMCYTLYTGVNTPLLYLLLYLHYHIYTYVHPLYMYTHHIYTIYTPNKPHIHSIYTLQNA